jgi:hypothetical protein
LSPPAVFKEEYYWRFVKIYSAPIIVFLYSADWTHFCMYELPSASIRFMMMDLDCSAGIRVQSLRKSQVIMDMEFRWGGDASIILGINPVIGPKLPVQVLSTWLMTCLSEISSCFSYKRFDEPCTVSLHLIRKTQSFHDLQKKESTKHSYGEMKIDSQRTHIFYT